MADVSLQEFGERLRTLIRVLGVQQKEFAQKGGIGETTLTGYLKGRSQPARDILSNWVQEFKINGHWLLTGEGEVFLSQGKAVNPPAAETTDPIAQRLETAERILRKSGAADAEIREAGMTIIRGESGEQTETGRKSGAA